MSLEGNKRDKGSLIDGLQKGFHVGEHNGSVIWAFR